MKPTFNHVAHPSANTWQAALHSKGQSGLRALNERRILTLIREHKELPKAQIAKFTGLSAQAATVIMNKLEEDGLVYRGTPQRGKRGQPTVPFSLNASGAFGLGLKIGRRSIEMTLIDFCGRVKASLREQWPFPTVSATTQFTEKALRAVTATLSGDEQQKISGLGVAMPFEIWRWADQTAAPEDQLTQWRTVNITDVIQNLTPLPVYLCNDDTAACAAELWFGEHKSLNDYLYCYVGTFLGGGVVLNRKLHIGRHGNAGAVASLPFAGAGQSQQMLDQASLYVLEKQLKANDLQADFLHQPQRAWPEESPLIADWVERVSDGLVHAAVSAHAFLDLDGTIIEGALPLSLKQKVIMRCKEKLTRADLRGLTPLGIFSGTLGEEARAVGSANLPLIAQYSS